MSFPVLQRRERKRPELIQPINWKAEALKGLASGIESGIKIATTMQKLQLARQDAARKEAESAATIALTAERTKELAAENRKRSAENKLEELYTQGEIINQTGMIAVQSERDVLDYIKGLSVIQRASGIPTGFEPVETEIVKPANFNQALSGGYLQSVENDAIKVVNEMQDPSIPAPDRFAKWDSLSQKVSGFSKILQNKAARGEPESFVTKMAQRLIPFAGDGTLTEHVRAIPVPVVITETNAKDPDLLAFYQAKQEKEGESVGVQQAIREQKVIQLPLHAVLGGLTRGFYVDDVAADINSAENPEPFIKYLEKRLAKKPDIMNQIKMKAGLIEDKVQDQRVNVSDDSLKLAEIPEAPVTETIMTPEGDYINVPTDLGIVSKIKNLKNKIEDGVAFRSMLSDIIKEAPDKPSMLKPGGIIPDTPKNYAYLKRLRDDWIIEQNDLVDKLQSENEDDIFRRKIGVATELASWLDDKVSLMETKGFKMETSFERTKRLDAEIMSDNYDPYKDTTQTQTYKQLKTVVDTSGKDDSMVTVRYKGRTLKIKRDDLDEALKAGAVLQQ